ncbi:MAG: NAD(P)/FAD-dependent oxidoreductase [Candidatus Competibacterales bacterium]
MSSEPQHIVIGAGPAGLTAGYEFVRHGQTPLVVEREALVGGISKTQCYRDCHFDLGGHRFYTKSDYVNRFWHDTLGPEFLRRPRLSRIYYQQRFFSYPPRPWNALKGLGFAESVRIVTSYVGAQLLPHRQPKTFAQWVTNAFGRRLFEIFFKSYTEKVWGISCDELRAEWAAQRIKGLSLKVVLKGFLVKSRHKVTTLIEEFHYPRLGPGMLWQAVARNIEGGGGRVQLSTDAVKIRRMGPRVTGVVLANDQGLVEVPAKSIVTSMPLTELIAKLDPPAPLAVQQAAKALSYRSFLTVCLIVDQAETFPDNWVYVHEPGVEVARIQNFKNWSPAMVADPELTSLGLEYFCNEDDATWTRSDGDLIGQASRELEAIGLVAADKVLDGCVFRVPKAYPVYDSTYAESLETLKNYCNSFENLVTVGRNGLHRYNNQDHSMITGLFAVRNLLFGEDNDIWSVNTSQVYLEERIEGKDEAETAGAPGEANPAAPVSWKDPSSISSNA